MRLFDARTFGAKPLADAFNLSAPSRLRSVWVDAEGREIAQGDLLVSIGDYAGDEAVGLFLYNSQGTFLRGEGRWYPLPPKSPLRTGWTVIDADTEMIHVWDACERADQLDMVDASLAQLLAPDSELPSEPAATPTGRLFAFEIPSDITLDMRDAEPGLIARGPFVVDLHGAKLLGCDLRRFQGAVTWSEGWREHTIEEHCTTSLYPHEGHILVGDPMVYNAHYEIRPMSLGAVSYTQLTLLTKRIV